MQFSDIPSLIARKASQSPDQLAVGGVNGEKFSYAELSDRIFRAASALRGAGVISDDCVAMVIPEGPGAAVSFLAITAAAACAPLNPAYSERDFEFYLNDLKPRFLILPNDYSNPAEQAAKKAGVQILRVDIPDSAHPSRFNLLSTTQSAEAPPAISPDSVALILHTSGTTSRPKMVPLTHRNLTSSAANISETLKLTEDDKGLVVMPLFHIHGLVGSLLSSLSAGASVIGTPKFDHDSFAKWLIDEGISWYSAVPTIHQAVLSLLQDNPGLAGKFSLRFVRSSSSALPPSVFHEMEKLLGVPVVESYGMTEASHQMSSNGIGPDERRAGSVGKPAGPEIRIVGDDKRTPLPTGEIGEIAISGPSIAKSYLANPEADQSSFADGWFLTGDKGSFDEEGFLRLQGRLKEMINRGGENIAPKEIDECLLEHPAVKQAVAFAVPHDSLGEDLAAAVILAPGSEISEAELRGFLAEKLAGFKVPSIILFVDEIPKGPTGKIQRIGLHTKLENFLGRDFEPCQTATEQMVADLFHEILGGEKIGRDDNFFYLGGDSLKGGRVLAILRDKLQLELPPSLLFRNPDVQELAAALEACQAEAGEDDLEDLARQLEGLSPDEIEKLLRESP